MKKLYKVVFYSDDGVFTAYYVIDEFECETIEAELENRLTYIVEQVQQIFNLNCDVPINKIYDALYVFQEDNLISVKDMLFPTSFEKWANSKK